MMRSGPRIFRNTDGAVAPTVALSLVALIAAGGIAFDYARMASMDTELQNAADQAVLAAASQLDGLGEDRVGLAGTGGKSDHPGILANGRWSCPVGDGGHDQTCGCRARRCGR